MEGGELTLNIKYKADTYNFKVKPAATILMIKELLQPKLNAPPKNQKLIYRGIELIRKNT